MYTLDPSWKQSVELDFWSYADWTAVAVGKRVLEVLQDLGLTPDGFGEERSHHFEMEPAKLETFLEVWAKRPDQLTIQGHQPVGFEAIAHLNPRKGDPPHSLHLAVHEEYFKNEKRVAKFLNSAEELYSLLQPVEGDIGHRRDRENKTIHQEPVKVGNRVVLARKFVPPNPTIGLSGIYWANFFGPIFVDFFSMAKLESAPCYWKKRLNDGGYLLLTSEGPLQYEEASTKKLELALKDHLGSDSFTDSSYPARKPRSPWERHDSIVEAGRETSPHP